MQLRFVTYAALPPLVRRNGSMTFLEPARSLSDCACSHLPNALEIPVDHLSETQHLSFSHPG